MEAAASFDMFDVDAEPGPSALVGGCSSASFPSHGLPATVSSLDLDTVQQMIDSVESKRLTRYSSIYRQSSQIKITEDEIWMRRVQLCLSKLTMLDPGRRAHKANLYRYFHIWSLCLPLTQKCNELGKQLRERSAALESVRDSYNRDCIM